MTTLYYALLASGYGRNPYDTGNYNGTNVSSGGLSNTGIAIGLIVGTAALILLVAMVVRIMRRPSKRSERDDNQGSASQ
ncbi:MAG TPA: hypothetical protein VLF69_05730 [Candidatus Saccharimonadales bacterium]|nr:hypothetical protein [Candidatus Saccharimonadales bacterium]